MAEWNECKQSWDVMAVIPDCRQEHEIQNLLLHILVIS